MEICNEQSNPVDKCLQTVFHSEIVSERCHLKPTGVCDSGSLVHFLWVCDNTASQTSHGFLTKYYTGCKTQPNIFIESSFTSPTICVPRMQYLNVSKGHYFSRQR